MRTLHHEILEMGGTAQLPIAGVSAGEAEIVDTFDAARDEEHDEFLGRCDDLLAEVHEETAQAELTYAELTYAELEEIDEDLLDLRGPLSEVTDRATRT
jgi:hypothetical protein